MKTLVLDLKKPWISEVPIKINIFPDKQLSVTLLKPEELYKKVKVIISCSLDNFNNFQLLSSAISAIKCYTNNYMVYSPYVIGARSDRKFENGGDFYFKDVIEPILRQYNCPIVALDLHCDSDLIKNVHPISLEDPAFFGDNTIIYPDSSAELRIAPVLKQSYKKCTFFKERINSGLVQEFNSNDDKNVFDQSTKFVILDDLFDGGASYVGLCEKIRTLKPDAKITIYVTHFIASKDKNLKKLKDLNVVIYMTNSYDKLNFYSGDQVITNVLDHKYVKIACDY